MTVRCSELRRWRSKGQDNSSQENSHSPRVAEQFRPYPDRVVPWSGETTAAKLFGDSGTDVSGSCTSNDDGRTTSTHSDSGEAQSSSTEARRWKEKRRELLGDASRQFNDQQAILKLSRLSAALCTGHHTRERQPPPVLPSTTPVSPETLPELSQDSPLSPRDSSQGDPLPGMPAIGFHLKSKIMMKITFFIFSYVGVSGSSVAPLG